MDESKKILLVDDVKLFLKLEETFFKRTGCSIITADSGEKALDMASSQSPDLILLDLIMPDMMGDEVIKKLRENETTKDIPIMVVSTSADGSDVKKCLEAGAQEYVTKPINAQELLAKAANILNIPHRVHFRVPVSIEVSGEAEDRVFTGFSRNISQGGILVDCSESIAPNSIATLSLPILSDGGELRMLGRVARSERDESTKTFLLGIQFFNLTKGQDQELNNFITSCKEREK